MYDRSMSAAEALDLVAAVEKIRDAESDLKEMVAGMRDAGISREEIAAVLHVGRDTVTRWTKPGARASVRRGRPLVIR